MMKSLGFILLLFVWSLNDRGWAADRDFLHGEVLKVDSAMQVMVVRSDSVEGDARMVTVLLPETVLIESPDGNPGIPGCIASGRHVRIWGALDRTNNEKFTAEEIRSCGMAACSDPTGVRSRLSRNRQGKRMGEMCR